MLLALSAVADAIYGACRDSDEYQNYGAPGKQTCIKSRFCIKG
jgi:hypothetical protein